MGGMRLDPPALLFWSQECRSCVLFDMFSLVCDWRVSSLITGLERLVSSDLVISRERLPSFEASLRPFNVVELSFLRSFGRGPFVIAVSDEFVGKIVPAEVLVPGFIAIAGLVSGPAVASSGLACLAGCSSLFSLSVDSEDSTKGI